MGLTLNFPLPKVSLDFQITGSNQGINQILIPKYQVKSLSHTGIQRYGTTMCVDLEETNWFFGPVWSRSVETAYKEEVEPGLETAMLAVVVGAVELSGMKASCPGVFLEALRDRQGYMEVDCRILDKVYMV